MSFSTVPLKLSGGAGVLLFAAAVILLIFKAATSLKTGQAFLSTDVILLAVLFISSLQMFFIYILGAYLSKDYMENKKRPLYIIKEKSE